MNVTKKDVVIISTCLCIFIAFIICGCFLISNKEATRDINITFKPVTKLSVPFKQPTVTLSTYQESFGASSGYNTSTSFASENTSFKEVIITASGANAELYNYCSRYFNVMYGQQSISPILPMAISNVETPGRADFSVTWSALFPSRIVPVDEMGTFDVTSVISNPNYFKALSSEYSTRDRGCLQMSPTYGTSNSSINALMSGTEVDKLKTVDTSQYVAWVKGASSNPGDRFYLPDVLLRMSSAMQLQCNNIAKNDYAPDNDFQLIAMLAMSHQSSGVWGNSNHGKSIGCWRSGELARDWALLVGSPEMVNALTAYALQSNATYIDSKTAKKIFSENYDVSTNTYATKDIVCYYPIKALYSYIKLCMLYTE